MTVTRVEFTERTVDMHTGLNVLLQLKKLHQVPHNQSGDLELN